MQGLARDCFRAAVGQPELIGKVSAFASWAHIQLAANYVGPRDSLVRQSAVCLMGQCELNVRIL